MVITDVMGKQVFQTKLVDYQIEQTVDISQLNSGIFIVNFVKEKQIMQSMKLVLISGE